MIGRAVTPAGTTPSFARREFASCARVALFALLAFPACAAAYDLSFDYTSFGGTFGQAQFDVLNYPRMNGSYMNTSTDNHRPEMIANGNELAQFYNWLTDRYTEQTVKNGAAAADAIHQYTMNNSYDTQFNPPRPDWLVLNEISPSLWSANPGSPSISTYRTWLIDCVTRLSQHYGYNVVTLAPFQEPAQNNASWQALQAVSYIGIECYLSGPEVWNSGSNYAERLAWAEGEYADSKQAYMNRGVPANRLFVTEHFANNGTHLESGQEIKWGRAGLPSASDWDQVIMIRQDAILNVGFDGFLAYNWGGNGMGVSQDEQIQHEYYYRTRRVLASQKPQWLSDSAINVNGTSIPLSWSQPLNWLGGVPNAPGAEVNFWRTITANRTVTLDGNKTAGKLTFDSSFSYTISAGSGGSILFNSAGASAILESNQGSHAITANIQLATDLHTAVAANTFTISGAISGSGGLSKTGAGSLVLAAVNSYSGDTILQDGTLRTTGRNLPDSTALYFSSDALLQLNYTGSPDIIDALFIDGVAQPAGIWGPLGTVSQYSTPLITGTGRLQVTNGPLPGDFNFDGLVDAADYIVLRKQYGEQYTTTHYDLWRKRFGAGAGNSLEFAVPENCNWSAVAIVFGVLMFHRASSRKLAMRILLLLAAICIPVNQFAQAQLSKGHRILIERGLQVQGMVTKDDNFHLTTYQNANYTAIHWLWESHSAAHGAAPGFPWARWVGDENQMPGAAEQPYLPQLVALQLGDEWHLNDPALRDRAVNWFNAIRSQWPDTILYMNNYGGQVNDASLSDFITRAQPDMLAFDTYPWKSTWAGPGQAGSPLGGQPTSWYGELRRYRIYAQNFGIPLAIYRQTFHAIQDYDQTVYRDPSPSELNLNTFGGLAFGATTFIDFTYNTGASSLFTSPGGDSNPTPLYQQQADINRRARNLGKTLVHLRGFDAPHNGALPTQDIMFLRGKTGPGTSDVTPLPIGFSPDDAAPNSFSEWTADRNDPYIRGWLVTNCGINCGVPNGVGTKNGGFRGDAIISWFKPLDSTLDDPNDVDDQLYFMVTNGFAGLDGTAADYRQRIQVNFLGSVGSTIQRLNSDTGEVELVNLDIIPNSGGRRKLVIELDGGMSELFKFNTGHPFLGFNAELSGDFNRDGLVNAADYVAWRKSPGSFGGDPGGYNAWRDHFGQTFVLGFGSHLNPAVPEPATLVLQIVAVTGWCLRRGRTA